MGFLKFVEKSEQIYQGYYIFSMMMENNFNKWIYEKDGKDTRERDKTGKEA